MGGNYTFKVRIFIMKRFSRITNNPEGQESVLDESKILIALKKDSEIKDLKGLTKALKLKVETNEKTSKHWLQINNTSQRYWIKSSDGHPIDEEKLAQI